jgi:choline kinase
MSRTRQTGPDALGRGAARKPELQAVILAAGRGVRLGRDEPKCLTPVGPAGATILDGQLAALERVSPARITLVVGFRKETIMQRHPALSYVENPRFASTNTARSLGCGLERIRDADVLWMNADVVFDPRVLPRVLACPHSCMAVNRSECRDEEIRYRTGPNGAIVEVSKLVGRPEGEAVGVNLVRARDLDLLRDGLDGCGDSDYFEKGIEIAIGKGLRVVPVDISDLPCVEVDFASDLEAARRLFGPGDRS